MPLFNWEKVLEGNYKFMCIERVEEYGEDEIKAFYTLYNKYLERYGLGKEYEEYIEAQKMLIEYNLQFVETGDRFLLNYITIEIDNMNRLRPTNEQGITIGRVVARLSKWKGGQWINKKEISVEEYKDLIEEYERSN